VDQAAASAAPESEAGAAAGKKPDKPSGKRPGTPGFWRRQPLVVHEDVPHRPHSCGACHAVLNAETPGRLVSAHHVLELECGDMALRLSAKKHCYFVVRCGCDQETGLLGGICGWFDVLPGHACSRRSLLRDPASIRFCVCCCGCGHVGNALALSTCPQPLSRRSHRGLHNMAKPAIRKSHGFLTFNVIEPA
jgi:hypothetical protein